MRYKSSHYRKQELAGIALLALTAFGFAACLYLAYTIDKANGISVCQSLAMWGL